MDIKIGLVHTPRELVISSNDAADDVASKVTEALQASQPTLELNDQQGRRFIVDVSRIAYVEIGASETRRVGFAGA